MASKRCGTSISGVSRVSWSMARGGAVLQPWRGRLHALVGVVAVVAARPARDWWPWELLPIGAGLLLRSWALGPLHKNEELCTSGPYAFTRNPLYLANGLILCGCCLAAGSMWFAIAAWLGGALACCAAVFHEEDQLLGRFGERYAAYRSYVPAVIPRITPYPGSTRAPFSWRQASRNHIAAGWVAVIFVLVAIHAAGAVASAWPHPSGYSRGYRRAARGEGWWPWISQLMKDR